MDCVGASHYLDWNLDSVGASTSFDWTLDYVGASHTFDMRFFLIMWEQLYFRCLLL